MKYYAVAVGREQGVFTTWDETKALVNGYKGAKYKSFATYQEAHDFAFKGVDSLAGTKVSGKSKAKESHDMKQFESAERTISSDAACSGNPGELEYQIVWNDTKEKIFLSDKLYGTNNIGEFLGLVDAIRFVRSQGLDVEIYTDSKTALAWVRNVKINSDFDWQNESTIKSKIEEAIEYLKNNPPYPKLMKWETKVYGEIPADFGRKSN